MLTSEAMLNLAAELTDAHARGDAESLAAIAWHLYGEAGEDLAETGRLRAAIHAAWNRPQETAPPVAARVGPVAEGAAAGRAILRVTSDKPDRCHREETRPAPSKCWPENAQQHPTTRVTLSPPVIAPIARARRCQPYRCPSRTQLQAAGCKSALWPLDAQIRLTWRQRRLGVEQHPSYRSADIACQVMRSVNCSAGGKNSEPLVPDLAESVRGFMSWHQSSVGVLCGPYTGSVGVERPLCLEGSLPCTRLLSHTIRATSTWATVTPCTGRSSARLTVCRRSGCTAARARRPPPAAGGTSTPPATGRSSSTSEGAGAAAPGQRRTCPPGRQGWSPCFFDSV
jgi:hypothetical protein